MTGFRVLMLAILVLILGYTVPVGMTHGWNLLPIFFGDIVAMGWPGQFNLDFSCFLFLSGTWVAWRNEFSPTGLLLAPVAMLGGALFLSIYLLVLSFSHSDMASIMLGAKRAAALRR